MGLLHRKRYLLLMINCCWSSHLVLMRNSKVLNVLTWVLTTSLMLQMRMNLGNGWAWSQGEKFVEWGNIYYGLEDWKSLDMNKTFIPPAFVVNTAQFTAIILVMVTKNQKNLHAEKQPASLMCWVDITLLKIASDIQDCQSNWSMNTVRERLSPEASF